MKLPELKELAKQMGLRGTSTMRKPELLATLQAARNGGEPPAGVTVRAPKAAKTAKALQWAGIAYELRTTLYPGMTLKTLCDLLAAFPPAPRWRVNYFRPPAVFRPQDVPLLQRPALTQPELMAARDALLAIQPNLIL